MTEYWLISAPGEKTCQQTWETMNNLTSKQNNLSVNFKFQIPDLKVGTLDQLVGLSDDLGKLDGFVEQITRKVAHYLGEVLEDQKDKLQENLMANNAKKSGKGQLILQQNKKKGAKGNVHFSLNNVEQVGGNCKAPDLISLSSGSSFGFVDEGGNWMDDNSNVFESRDICNNYSDDNMNRSKVMKDILGHHLRIAELQTYITRFQWDIAKYPIKQSLKNIADIISKQVGQIDADLKTKSTAYNNLKGSLQNLEKKQSGSLLTRNLADLVKKEHFILDSEYLTTLLVIVPRSMTSEWHAHYEKLTEMIVPRSTQLIVQDSEYCLYTVSLFKKVVEEFKMHAREKKFVVRDFTYNEEELAAGKSEITKYGLPVNFQAILIHPNKKTSKRLRDVLNQLYGHLDSSALQGGGNIDSVDIPGLGFGQSEYYPYVYYKLNVDMIDAKV